MRVFHWAAAAFFACAIGCGGESSAPAGKAAPAAAAAAAITQFDKDGDGELAGAEIEGAPALKHAMAQIDANKSGSLTRQELEQRFTAYTLGSRSMSLMVNVSGPKGPIVGAEVTLTPEPYMGEGLPTYTGTTIAGGSCELKGSDPQYSGVLAGLYQVHVVGQGLDKVIGCEVTDDLGNRLLLKL